MAPCAANSAPANISKQAIHLTTALLSEFIAISFLRTILCGVSRNFFPSLNKKAELPASSGQPGLFLESLNCRPRLKTNGVLNSKHTLVINVKHFIKLINIFCRSRPFLDISGTCSESGSRTAPTTTYTVKPGLPKPVLN
jgi:hypothetical protein